MGYDKIPRQKLPIKKKDIKWREACVEAFIDLSNQGTGYSTNKDNLKRLYDYYNGTIDEDDYKHVLKPYGKSRSNFPSKMRNFPIIKPIIDLLLGEKSKRPLNFSVVVKNADSISLKEEALNQQIYQSLAQMLVNKMNAQGVETGTESQDVQLPQHIAEQFQSTYVDNRAIKGQQAINYIMQNQEIFDKMNKAWFHFLISGEVYTYRGVRGREPFYEILNPLDVDYDKDPDLDFVEDGDWALVRKYVHASTIVDYYRDYLDDDEILRLEEPEHGSLDSYLTATSRADDRDKYRERLIEVVNVFWKSRKRIGFLQFLDPDTGEIEEVQVEDGFRMPKELKEAGARLDWEWINEVWE